MERSARHELRLGGRARLGGTAGSLIAILAVAFCPLARAQPKPDVLTVGIATIPPHVMADSDGPAGFDIDLWQAVGHQIGAEWTFRQMEFASLMAAVKQGSVDVAAAGISMTHDRELELDFSLPYMHTGLKILTSADLPSSLVRLARAISTRSVMLPLASVMGFIALCSVFLFFAERGGPLVARSAMPGIFQAAWCTLATVTTVGYGDIAPRTWVGRLLCVIAMLLGIALFGITIAELSSGLTVNQLESGPSSLADLEGLKVATVAGTTSEELARLLAGEVHTTGRIREAYPLLESGIVDAVLFDASPLMHYAQQNASKDLVVTGELIGSEHYAFAFPSGSDLRERVNRALLHLFESGEYERIYANWFGDSK